ncbi:MAG: hypothetical protein E6I56_01105 [Chloroflexi bacterium]|nr:MAG: hypothetical protein E6I56_01105 [Chloroflexota bacterium]
MRAACSGLRLVTRLITGLMLPLGSMAGASIGGPLPVRAAGEAPSCVLASPSGAVSHVIYVQFDNTHFTRDNPKVPSDLEQMPNLLNFIKDNGVLLSNHHTPLISHTATDILTSLTGVYGDRHGVPVSNSFRYFNPDGTTNPGVSFAYWTSPLFDPSGAPTDTTPNMLTADGKNAPAPWVPFTRAGCNVGAVATANTILENTAIDIPTVFGANSDEAKEVTAHPNQAFADFVGIGVHCGLLQPLCLTSDNAKDDKLPAEPGLYTGFKALYGHKYTAEKIGPITDLDGNVISGFPGFDGMSASVSLGYVAAMQEHGIPVTYAYVSDAHDAHPSGPAYGPGQAGYVAALKSYDTAFGKFFARLKTDGIDRSNTLFVFTADENDHLSSGPPDNPNGGESANRPDRSADPAAGQLSGDEATPYGDCRRGTHAQLHAICQPRLLPLHHRRHRLPNRVPLGHRKLAIRLEPRRLPAGNRDHVAWHGWAGRCQSGRRRPKRRLV